MSTIAKSYYDSSQQLKEELGLSEICHAIGVTFDGMYADKTGELNEAVEKRRSICMNCPKSNMRIVNNLHFDLHTRHQACLLNKEVI